MPRRRTLTVTAPQRRELVQARDHDPRQDVRERCAAMLKIADGASAHWVARHGLLKPRDPDSVSTWLTRYEADGLAGLIPNSDNHLCFVYGRPPVKLRLRLDNLWKRGERPATFCLRRD